MKPLFVRNVLIVKNLEHEIFKEWYHVKEESCSKERKTKRGRGGGGGGGGGGEDGDRQRLID